MGDSGRSFARTTAMAATFLALNVGLAKVANLLSLPFTFDTVGTILAAALLPLWSALLVSVLSSALGSIVIHPAFVFYVGTQVVICLAAFGALRLGLFARAWTAVLAGMAIGLLSALVSAPVTVVVFGGVSVPSITALNVLFLAAGNSLWRSVVTGSLIVESVDKAVAGLLASLVLARLPRRIRGTSPGR